VDTSAEDVALIAFTSGTTGRPKGCVHFHRDVLAPADTFARHIVRPRAGDVWACSAPIAFTFGLGMQLIFPLRFRGTAVTLERTTPPELLQAIERFGINVLGTAPTAYKAMLSLRRAPAQAGAQASAEKGLLLAQEHGSLRICVSAGEHLPEATWRAWHEHTGLDIIDGIGATEMMHIFISASGDDIRPGATGRAVPGYRACILDEEGKPLTHGTGRLAVKGPTGCRYLADERQADYVQDGWNVTGDTYHQDEEGYFRYIARSDDMIVSSGYNIAAPEVENALLSHPAVAECAVIGVPCEERGQRVKAFVVPAPPHGAGEALAERLKAHVKAAIAPYKYPRDIAFVEALPRTATGKLQRHALRDDPLT
jgi:2-aminobenzoate-CoA ligase